VRGVVGWGVVMAMPFILSAAGVNGHASCVFAARCGRSWPAAGSPVLRAPLFVALRGASREGGVRMGGGVLVDCRAACGARGWVDASSLVGLLGRAAEGK